MDKGQAHVKMWKSGLEASLEEINGTDEVKKSSKALKPSDERDLVEKTGMGWVEQVVLHAAMSIVLSRAQAHKNWGTRETRSTRRSSSRLPRRRGHGT